MSSVAFALQKRCKSVANVANQTNEALHLLHISIDMQQSNANLQRSTERYRKAKWAFEQASPNWKSYGKLMEKYIHAWFVYQDEIKKAGEAGSKC